MPKHAPTPGPWRQSPGASDAIISDTCPERYPCLDDADCLAHYGGYVIAESVLPENMAIIIASPDLLEACERALRWMGVCTLDDEQETLNLLRLAIAKAHGNAPADPSR